ncbi:MAG: transporter suffix domain-containing protein [Saprospiraceae bacterium]|jgi:hypothetical protein|nr:transporter suffix domain-containing protein [Saprospiraceae bacterium]
MYWKTKIGWLLLALSLCCTALVFSLPFSDMPVRKITVGVAAAMITGKSLFAVSAMLLGKPVLEQLKNRFRFWKKKG